MLSGQMPPTSGTANVLGIDVVADPIAVKAAIGIVPEIEYLPSFLTVEEYLHFVSSVRGLPENGIVDRWIEFFGLGEKKETMCMSLSKGQKKNILELAEKLCTRVGIIDKGKLVAVGSLEELRKIKGEDLEQIFRHLFSIVPIFPFHPWLSFFSPS